GDIRDTFSGFLGVASNEVLDEQRNIFGSLAQRRNYDRKNIQPVEKVGAEGSRRHRSPQVTIGCRDHPYINRDWMIAPHPLKFLLLQPPEEENLRSQGESPDFTQKQRPAVGRYKSAPPPLQRAGESALLVPEKLGSNQRLRNRSTVDTNEWSIRPL